MQHLRNVGQFLKRYSIKVQLNVRGEEKEEAEEPFILIMTKNFPKLMTEKKTHKYG